MITTKRHNKIIKEYKDYILGLEKELREAKCLKSILEKLEDKTNTFTGTITGNLYISDDIAQYVDDYFGGKVIRQESTKLIEIDKDGNAKQFFTREKPDKGYKYKLIRK